MKKLLKENQHFLMKVMNLCLIIGVCIGYHSIASVRAEKTAEIEKENQALAASQSKWADGTFEGTGTGFGGDIIVRVTIEEGLIDDIEIVSADKEDSAYFDNAKSVLDQMFYQQTADVDIASGATYSSNGIIEAVKNALKEAQ